MLSVSLGAYHTCGNRAHRVGAQEAFVKESKRKKKGSREGEERQGKKEGKCSDSRLQRLRPAFYPRPPAPLPGGFLSVF